MRFPNNLSIKCTGSEFHRPAEIHGARVRFGFPGACIHETFQIVQLRPCQEIIFQAAFPDCQVTIGAVLYASVVYDFAWQYAGTCNGVVGTEHIDLNGFVYSVTVSIGQILDADPPAADIQNLSYQHMIRILGHCESAAGSFPCRETLVGSPFLKHDGPRKWLQKNETIRKVVYEAIP
jgi:hypothetical protein